MMQKKSRFTQTFSFWMPTHGTALSFGRHSDGVVKAVTNRAEGPGFKTEIELQIFQYLSLFTLR